MVNHLLALDVLDDGAVARRIRHRQVKCCQPVLAGHLIGDDDKRLLAQRIDRLRDRREIIQHILRPERDGESGLVRLRLRVARLDQPQQVRVQPLLVHAVGGRDIVARGDDASILGAPFDRMRPCLSAAMYPSGQYPQVGPDIVLPIHRSGGDDGSIRPQVDSPRAGLRAASVERKQKGSGSADHQAANAPDGEPGHPCRAARGEPGERDRENGRICQGVVQPFRSRSMWFKERPPV